jgi:predicted TPR repeat methyltransferase
MAGCFDDGVNTAPYDEIADWYEHKFRGTRDARASDPLGITHCLRALLGTGGGACLEIGCGTGVHAATVRDLGWTLAGVDISAGMLRHVTTWCAIRLLGRSGSLRCVGPGNVSGRAG